MERLKKILRLCVVLCLVSMVIGCGERPEREATVVEAENQTVKSTEVTRESGSKEGNTETLTETAATEAETINTSQEETIMKMNVQVGDTMFTATLERNKAVDALVEMMQEGPVVLHLSDYAGFEKVGPLGTTLPSSNQNMTTNPGDIVLYNNNQIVMFYGSNSWSYTKLGTIDDLTGWESALGSGSVTVTFCLD